MAGDLFDPEQPWRAHSREGGVLEVKEGGDPQQKTSSTALEAWKSTPPL